MGLDMGKLLWQISELFYPTLRCLVCAAETELDERFLCCSCAKALGEDRLTEPDRLEKGRYAPFVYQGKARELIIALKFAGRRQNARLLGEEMARCIARSGKTFDRIVPVPLSRKRKRARRYNQAGLLAKWVSKSTGIVCDEKLLVRVRETLEQTHLSAQERRKNVWFAFESPNGRAKGLRILLIDDVYTTGATTGDCIRALRSGQAAEITVLCAAAALSKDDAQKET